MLLPIVLLLAGLGSPQQADKAATTPEQSTAQEQHRTVISNPGSSRFVNPGGDWLPHGKVFVDHGIVVSEEPCLPDGTCKAACASINAYVFSDGENPKLQYVTDCPNLDAPYRTKRAHDHVPDTKQRPDLKRTKN
jgi:hypothetical protein